MILVVCTKCKCGLRISPGDQQGAIPEGEALFGKHSEFFPDKYPCLRCNEHMSFVPAAEPQALSALDLYDVNPQEAMAAMHGLGLPTERDCSAAAVAVLLSGGLITSVRTKQIRNSHRCVLEYIELACGTKVYVGSSAYGATVYRVVHPSSYVEKLNA